MPKKEQTPKISIQELAQVAKAVTLKEGGHAPTVFAHGEKQHVAVKIDYLPETHDERAQQMFLIGLQIAQQSDIGVLQQVFFISEGWMSVADKRRDPQQLPSKDPKRKEILQVTGIDLTSGKQEMIIFEMKRNQRDNVKAVQKIHEYMSDDKEKSFDAPLLQSFVIGFLGLGSTPND